MRNSWGRPPHNEMWSDIQAIAIWVVIVGVVGYLLFPSFFQNVYSALTNPLAQSTEINEISLPTTTNTGSTTSQTTEGLPDVYSSIYGESEFTDGYWVVFVADGELKQMQLSLETYNFIMKIIANDKQTEKNNTIIIAENGKVHKYIVSNEVFGIISNINTINAGGGTI